MYFVGVRSSISVHTKAKYITFSVSSVFLINTVNVKVVCFYNNMHTEVWIGHLL